MKLKETIAAIEELFQTSTLSNEQIANRVGVTRSFVDQVWLEYLQELMAPTS